MGHRLLGINATGMQQIDSCGAQHNFVMFGKQFRLMHNGNKLLAVSRVNILNV